ncbi:unnamed protein product [Trichogramma brassicae]|uniref:Uncharacterized protein n=1 Tax=Trichogramma brassicae TaxID=86971 RepID=A0A6H5I5Q8_9HYME|nr:unnamed protein product [Trichogramma brassicae]
MTVILTPVSRATPSRPRTCHGIRGPFAELALFAAASSGDELAQPRLIRDRHTQRSTTRGYNAQLYRKRFEALRCNDQCISQARTHETTTTMDESCVTRRECTRRIYLGTNESSSRVWRSCSESCSLAWIIIESLVPNVCLGCYNVSSTRGSVYTRTTAAAAAASARDFIAPRAGSLTRSRCALFRFRSQTWII